MKTRMNFKDEFYQKLKLLVLPIAIQNFMLALVSATDAIMLGWIDQCALTIHMTKFWCIKTRFCPEGYILNNSKEKSGAF